MTITVEAYTGTASVSTTEISLTTGGAGPAANTNLGVYQAFIDVNAIAGSDVFQIKCYEKARTGDAQRSVFSAYLSGAQVDPIAATPTLILGIGWDITIVKISGTDRTINWRISKVA